MKKDELIMESISKEARRLGIRGEDIEINYYHLYNIPYIKSHRKWIHSSIINKLKRKIIEIMNMNKWDEAVKEKFGEKPSDKAWVKFSKFFGFKDYYIKRKIERKIKELQIYANAIDRELDLIKRNRDPEEIKRELIKSGYIKEDNDFFDTIKKD